MTTPRPLPLLISVIAGLSLAPPAPAGDDDARGSDSCMHARAAEVGAPPGFDPDTGRNLRAYPPDRIVDYIHMRLDLSIPDMNTPRASAVQTLTVQPISGPVPSLTLDARLLEIAGVQAGGRPVRFEHDGQRLVLTFDPPLPPGVASTIITTYTINDPPRGMIWTPESPAWPGRAAQIHTQGQSDFNSYWFPCHDFPNERLTTEIAATVPAGFIVSSNGRLVEHAASGKNETWRWLQDKPHVNYLVSLVVGKFDVVDVAELAGRAGRKPPVPMPVYAPPGRGPDVARTYGRTPEMVELFARLLDEPYPWDRYAQLIVWNFGAGGMENTSATTLYDTAILSRAGAEDGDIEGLISHELAHQWFGDLITCNSWEHIWLNEGFATYFSQLWVEHSRGVGAAGRSGEAAKTAGRDAYLAGILSNFNAVRASDRADAPSQAPMCRKTYADPGETFGGAANPYSKGSSILHMLRMRLGDEVFFRGLGAYVDRFKLRTAETADLRKVMEEVSGESLEQFFTQWCFRPGIPDLDIALDWDTSAGELVISVKQTQKIDGDNPAFEFELPVFIAVETPAPARARAMRRAPAATTMNLKIPIRAREGLTRVKLEREPAIVAIDPELHVLSRPTIHQPQPRWLAQLDRGPSLPARFQAARALAGDSSAAGRQALLRTALDAQAPARVREYCIDALADREDAAALLELAGSTLDPVDVRALAVGALASLAPKAPEALQERMKATLVGYAAGDPSFRTRAEAIRGLGALKAQDQLKLILAAAETPSQHDRVRQAALEALGRIDAPGTLPTAVRFAMPGTYNRTRPAAINAIVKLAHHDRESAFRALTILLRDREQRAWTAAASALVDLGDPRGIEELEKLAADTRDPADQKWIRAWADALRAKAAPAAPPS